MAVSRTVRICSTSRWISIGRQGWRFLDLRQVAGAVSPLLPDVARPRSSGGIHERGLAWIEYGRPQPPCRVAVRVVLGESLAEPLTGGLPMSGALLAPKLQISGARARARRSRGLSSDCNIGTGDGGFRPPRLRWDDRRMSRQASMHGPQLRINPAADVRFRRDAEEALATSPMPATLRAALRQRYPEVKVRARDRCRTSDAARPGRGRGIGGWSCGGSHPPAQQANEVRTARPGATGRPNGMPTTPPRERRWADRKPVGSTLPT
jgi:hypothetical protein